MDQTSKAVTTGVIVNRIITVANLALTFALFISGSGGSLTGYAGGVEKKMRLLTLENSEAAKFYQ